MKDPLIIAATTILVCTLAAPALMKKDKEKPVAERKVSAKPAPAPTGGFTEKPKTPAESIILPVNPWLHTLQEAELSAEGRLVLAYYTQPGCAPCKKFWDGVLTAPGMQQRLSEYVLLKCNDWPEKGSPEDQILSRHKNATGSPFVIVREPTSGRQYGWIPDTTDSMDTKFLEDLKKAERYIAANAKP